MNNGLLSVDDGVSKVIDADASLVAREYYTEYAKYVLEYRALPSVYDGLKPVQRRVIYIANQQPKKLMKTAKLSGLVLALHPHSSDSITGAINNMAHPLNRLPLFTTKGNFGGVNSGPAADRYTECYLSEVARLNFCQFVDYADYEVGEIGEMEPSSLPTLIPYCLIEGSEGIAVGLSTKVMPLNLLDLVDYYIDFIKNDGKTKKRVKPDLGYVLLENDDIEEAVMSSRGRVTTSSIVTQISNKSFLVEGLYGKSLDAMINKIDKWDKSFTKSQVGFRDASGITMKYVFEIYDDKYPTVKEFKESLEWASRVNTTFYRVLEEDGNAIKAKLNYVVNKSLECLNKAIDKKISTEKLRCESQLKIYEVLKLCKQADIFKNVTKMTTDELINLIVRTTSCDESIAKEIVKKPISYLTRSHDSEEDNLRGQIKTYENHNRKSYLLSLYKEFRKAILPIYESKKHSITSQSLIKNPRVKFENGVVKVTDGDGEEFDSIVYFISDKGYVYPRSPSTVSASEILVETAGSDEIIGFVTDKYSYLVLKTRFNKYPDWNGAISLDLSAVKSDKRFVSLREEDQEEIYQITPYTKVCKEIKEHLKSKCSKTDWVNLQ